MVLLIVVNIILRGFSQTVLGAYCGLFSAALIDSTVLCSPKRAHIVTIVYRQATPIAEGTN